MKHIQIRQWSKMALVLFAMSGLLAACGGTAAQTTTAPATSETTVGDLADRMAIAWPGIKSYRMIFTTDTVGLGTPVNADIDAQASPVAAFAIIDEVVLPDRKRRLYQQGDTITSEFIAINGRVYAWGALAAGFTSATPEANGWISIDPDATNPNTPLGQLVQSLVTPSAPPYSDLTIARRNRVAKPLGTKMIAGRTCTAYGIADTTATGEKIDVTLSLDEHDLPCAIETQAGGTNNITTFTFNMPLTIEQPTT